MLIKPCMYFYKRYPATCKALESCFFNILIGYYLQAELFDCVGPIADVMLDNGLTLALCNLITSVSGSKHLSYDDKTVISN